MKIKYLGTGAAEGIPGLFCNCKLCNYARKAGGKEIRTRSQSIIDGKILIDFPADTYMHVINYGLDLRDVHTCIITHSHCDHLAEDDLWCRSHFIANDIEDIPLTMYATHSAYKDIMNRIVDAEITPDRVQAQLIKPFEPFEAEGYRFIPLKANHDFKVDPVFYIIEKDEKTLLYANDTGYFPPETWDYLAKYERKFDFISFDCTCIMKDMRDGHMGLVTNNEVKTRLDGMGLTKKETVVYVNHFSHNRAAPHAEQEKAAAEYGFLVAYDGLEVEF